MERIRNRLAEVKTRLTEIYRSREETEARERTQQRDEQAAFEKLSAEIQVELDKKIQKLNADDADKRKRVQEKWRKRAARVSTITSRMKDRIDNASHSQVNILEEQQRTSHVELTKRNDEKVAACKQKYAEDLEELKALESAAAGKRINIQSFASEYGGNVDSAPADEVEDDSEAGDFDSIDERLHECEETLADTRRKLRRAIPAVVAYILIVVVHALAGVYLYSNFKDILYAGAAGVSLLIIFPIVYSLYNSRNDEAVAAAAKLMGHLGGTLALIEGQKELMKQVHEKALVDLDAERVQNICGTYEKLENQRLQVSGNSTKALEKLQNRRTALAARVAQRGKDDTAKSEKEMKERTAALRAQYEKRLADATAKFNAKKQALETEAKTRLEQLENEWNSILTSLGALCDDERRKVFRNLPGPDNSVTLPTKFAQDVEIGSVRIDLREIGIPSATEGRFSIPADLARLVMPLALSFPLKGSLLIRGSSYVRKRAMDTLFGAVIRLLSSFPPSKAKMTIIDPVGLGQNFAALMHLADYDETLVNSRIWSDTVHIERKLTELTEHMEKVIQKYLRNRYTTIDDYNREAGELAEPYRFLIVADFPTGFSELAVERLCAIINSGARCGVYTIILHDSRQKLPMPLDDNQLRRNCMFINETGNGLAYDDESLARPLVVEEEPPPAAAIDALLNTIGKQCREAGRVQVPFNVVIPQPDKYWSETSEPGIRVPLGKTGADRLQYLDLGKGTSQHALIAGKTGSGKSNLVHVIITSAALWYSPKEVEFYLIDFKKGVEFKTYATNRLSHVRVVAIESDREFGLSVLRRIDKELTARGEMFRHERVQDFASYRKKNGVVHLPRTMLVIDEFQEFFVDDDEVAQDASLLLDRIVRQGRAFGIHVILGSQTLGGNYTLSKSTLGQMAVRIALQCNEADSYLILNDDNGAAALLSRPGEAIYNDMSGQIEGNNPFQAVFLPNDGQEPYLRALRQKSVESGMESLVNVAIFEGNSLADLRSNSLLREVSTRQPAASAVDKVWLGEANSIKGPTEVEFAAQAGANLLSVGQRGGAEVAMCCATMLCLAANNSPQDVHIRILDGTAPDSGARERLMAVKNVLPYDIEIIDPRQTGKTIEELDALVKSRQKDESAPSGKYYLFVLGVEKFKMLRQDEDYGFSSSDDSGAVSPSKGFSDILVEGPAQGVHTIVWCDTLGNLNRTFSRKTLREFENRVLYQMSATDSSELIDTPAANRLGLYNAMLYSSQTGAVEKFRPYALPDMELIEEVGRNLSARAKLAQNNSTRSNA